MVPPAGEIGDDVLEGVEGGADKFVIHVNGEAGEEVNQVIPSHVCWHDARDSCHTRLEKIQFGFDRAAKSRVLHIHIYKNKERELVIQSHPRISSSERDMF